MPRIHRPRQTQAATIILIMVAAQFLYLLLQFVALAGSFEGTRQYEPPILYPSLQFEFEGLDDSEAIFKFRFSKGQILAILPYLRLDLVHWSTRYHPDNLTALCILLRRLAYPERWGSMTRDFGRSRSYLCSVARDVVLHLIDRFGGLLEWDRSRLTPETLFRYASYVEKKCGYPNVWGFIDSTFRPTTRPTENQRLVYSGYKHPHGFKVQAAATPDGIISSLSKPMEGKIGDWAMLKESGLEEKLKEVNSVVPDDRQLFVYGDPAYTEGCGIMGPFKTTPAHLVLTPDEADFNVRMSGVRIAVEQLFGHVLNKWAYNAYKYGLRQQSTPVAGFIWSRYYSPISTPALRAATKCRSRSVVRRRRWRSIWAGLAV